jgi:hypothetical protein
MAQKDLIDQTFMLLYSKQDGMTSFKAMTEIEKDMMAAIRLLDTIYDCGFLNKELQKSMSDNHGHNIHYYSIKPKGVEFVENLPSAFKDKPYSYYLKLEADKKVIQDEKDAIDYKIKQITLKSIPTNKNIALWGLFIAFIAILAPIVVNIINGNKTIKTELVSPDLNKIQQTQEQELQMLKDVLDSLRKK